MKPATIKKTAIDSCKKYYDYLNKEGRGLDVIPVNSIQRTNENIFHLKLGKKIFNLDAIEYCIRNQKYTISQIPCVHYDSDNNSLIIEPKKEYRSLFYDLKAKEITIDSDLKFLVDRTREWYEKYGSKLLIPAKHTQSNEVEYFSKKISNEQAIAIKTALTEPFTYVWGAPGTGKTRFVLKNCLMHYIKLEKRVAVFAPTNNSLEQVLEAVLEEKSIDEKKVLRLGTPSKKFAQKYPKVCEIEGINKRITELRNEKEIISNCIKARIKREEINILRNDVLPLFEEAKECILKQEKLQRELKEKVILHSARENILNDLKNKIGQENDKLNEIKRILSSRTFKIASLFSKKYANRRGEEKDQILILLKSLISEHDQTENDISLLIKDISLLRAKCNDMKVNEIMCKIISGVGFSEKLSPKFIDLNRTNLDAHRTYLVESIARAKSDCENKEAIARDYLTFSIDILNAKINEIDQQIDFLKAHSTEARLEEVNIIAGTLDAYISRFYHGESDEEEYKYKFNVDHIFLDEAGYCNLIKGATLLINRCPITFLGDHMQLPPVCEMDDSIMQKNNNESVYLWGQSVLYAEDLFSKGNTQMAYDYIESNDAEFKYLKKINLTATYRFGSALADILGKHIYKDGFYSESEDDGFRIAKIDAKKIVGKAKRDNPGEAKEIKIYLEKHNYGAENFVILTPYKDQVKCLGEYMRKEKNNGNILTIHRSQGREWEVVIFSVSDTKRKWFTDSKNKKARGLRIINTAISRAKTELIIVCDCSYWKREEGQLICELLKNAESVDQVN